MLRIVGLYMLLLAGALNALAVPVDGNVSLAERTDLPANLWVRFYAIAPPARDDSALVNPENGRFGRDLTAGAYRILFQYPGYAAYELRRLDLTTPVTLPHMVLMPMLRGHISGSLGPGQFDVVDSLIVDAGAELTLEPGTDLYFRYGMQMVVRGRLRGMGEDSGPVFFRHRYALQDSLWNGLHFDHAQPSVLDYCRFEHARGVPVNEQTYGGAVQADSTALTVSHSVWQWNPARWGALYMVGGSLNMAQCVVQYTDGMGLHLWHVTGTLDHVRVAHSRYEGLSLQGGHPVLTDCLIERNGNGALLCSDSCAAELIRCELHDNSSQNHGAALLAFSGAHPILTGCSVRRNLSALPGGPIYATGADLTLDNCLIAENGSWNSATIWLDGGRHRITRCTIAANGDGGTTAAQLRCIACELDLNSSIIAAGDGCYGLFFDHAPAARITYSAIGGNEWGIYRPASADTALHVPPGFAALCCENANGDPCDAGNNILLDPLFLADGSYALSATSPCIDAGDPTLPADSDGTVADMGAFGYDPIGNTGPRPAAVPDHLSLRAAYPNPFNATTTLEFELSHAGDDVRLVVYDVTGRQVAVLFEGARTAGTHAVRWDAGELPSGLYFVRLAAGAQVRTQKVVLLK